ncbi:hypothetical protein TIFTF001_016832 [Ficus carica]|uniref:Uncharacterized protein n=1 Tax=Ficus carica TaxID=3494 RepID=A0AA88AB49_FICCA|nr:hypothetical protein TIFTF001_016832 [Ficus carica]
MEQDSRSPKYVTVNRSLKERYDTGDPKDSKKMIRGESSIRERISLPPYKKEEYKKISHNEIIIIENHETQKSPDQITNHYLPFHLHPSTVPKSREKRKLLPEEKQKLKQILQDSSEEENNKEDRSLVTSEESYRAVYRG